MMENIQRGSVGSFALIRGQTQGSGADFGETGTENTDLISVHLGQTTELPRYASFADLNKLMTDLDVPTIQCYLLDDNKNGVNELGMLFGTLLIKVRPRSESLQENNENASTLRNT